MLTNILKICAIALYFAGWLAFCIFKLNKWHRRKKNCTEELSVEVVDVLERKPMRGSSMLYKPVFKPVNSTDSTLIDSAYYSNLIKFDRGDKVELLVNPNNRNEFLYKDDSLNRGKIVDIISCFFPAIIPILWLCLS